MMREQADPERLRFEYDLLGRQTAVRTEHASLNGFLLYQFFYDTPLSEPGCPTPTRVNGRLAYRVDSYGRTWYSYNDNGQVVMEIRQKGGVYGSCTGSYDTNPHTAYAYDVNGNLISIGYPRGRQVNYLYGTGGNRDRVGSITASLYLGGAWQTTTLLVDVEWMPYGEVRRYTLATSSGNPKDRNVEYLRSGAPQTAPTATACSLLPRDVVANDESARLRHVWVSSGSNGTSGDVMKKTLTWSADLVTQEDTCFLAQPNPHRQVYAFDRSLRLVSTSSANVPVEFGASAAATYGYDARGNRTTHTRDGVADDATFDLPTAATKDMLRKQFQHGPDTGSASGSTVVYDYFYDADGRLLRMNNGYALFNLSFSYLASGTVMRNVTINGSTFTYAFDAFGRRRVKLYPFDRSEEFFYDTGHQLLSDQSLALDAQNQQILYVQQDDYVWLAGRPVAVVRGRFASNWTRQDESSTASCARFSVEGTPACGAYGIVTDQIGKPVLVIRSADGKVASTALYDDFGLPNRVRLAASTPFPVGPGFSAQIGRIDWAFSPGAVETVSAKVLYSNITTSTGNVTVNGTGSMTGFGQGHVWSPFVPAPTGVVVNANNLNGSGAFIESVEYRRSESGVDYWLPPLRFPGQYHDPETDFFENWNRYYDPLTGRYLQPEPLIRSPDFVRAQAQRGRSTPAYVYALNNPIYYVDRDGRHAAAGALTGAEIGGAVAGPVGAVVGAIAGAAAAAAAAHCLVGGGCVAPPPLGGGAEGGSGHDEPLPPKVPTAAAGGKAACAASSTSSGSKHDCRLIGMAMGAGWCLYDCGGEKRQAQFPVGGGGPGCEPTISSGLTSPAEDWDWTIFPEGWDQ